MIFILVSMMGVPQGSVLRLQLLMFFTNDLPEDETDCHITMFTDDTTITICGLIIESD